MPNFPVNKGDIILVINKACGFIPL